MDHIRVVVLLFSLMFLERKRVPLAGGNNARKLGTIHFQSLPFPCDGVQKCIGSSISATEKGSVVE